MGRNANGQFQKGESGNPSGRPKRSDAEKRVIEGICELAPKAVEALQKMIENEETPSNVRIRAVELVIDRICGKAMTASDMLSYEAEPSEQEKEISKLINDHFIKTFT